MKWGVRRYQNADGTLTEAGKKRLRNQVDKNLDQSRKDIFSNKAQQDRWLKSYNGAANRMNNGLIEKYNADYDKKLGDKAQGHDYDSDDEYNSGYEKLFDKVFAEEWSKQLKSEIENSEGFRKAQELLDKYGEQSLSETAKQAFKEFNELKTLVNNGFIE